MLLNFHTGKRIYENNYRESDEKPTYLSSDLSPKLRNNSAHK